MVNPTVECYAITIRSGEALQDSKQKGLNKGDIKGTSTKPPKEEIVINAIQYLEEEDEEWCMRMDVIEGHNREVPQEEAMQKFQAKQGRYDVLDDTNQDFVMQELDAIVQKNIAEMQQEHLELQLPRVDKVQPNNNGKVQQKTKYATLKGRQTMMLNSLPTILKYAFLGNAKNLTYQCKILVGISHMLNTMKHEIRKLWDPGKCLVLIKKAGSMEKNGAPAAKNCSIDNKAAEA
ncbi:hypothetical protein PIB30_067931 [Stylosanthes scabra]|uniref:Uncharacterized protein n=1 Tax=Stylosanthes scabra TaxID=79078 RepID=A0ABU6TNB9_9FABA|nr:hypothetical protein [Stylosanthes scabra]